MGHLLLLSVNHLLCALLSHLLARDVLPAHSALIANMSPAMWHKTQGSSLMEVDSSLPIMANTMDIFASKAQPGYCLIDTWQKSIKYDLEIQERGTAVVALDLALFNGMVFELGHNYLDQVQRWWAVQPPIVPAQLVVAHV